MVATLLSYRAARAGLLLLLGFAGTDLSAASPTSGPLLTEPAKLDFFEKRIRPVLVDRCYECHSAESSKIKGGLRMDNREDLLKGGDTGPGLVPGDPGKSRIIEAIRYQNQDLQMPPKSPLKPEQVRDLEQWVSMGAPDPRSKSDAKPSARRVINLAEGRKFWSFQPIANPPPPPVKRTPWIRTGLDNFVLAKLEEKKLKPAPPADKRSLIRRATFDLTGLPPTPAEIEAFLADKSPRAFATVIERLLASPQYGERWGRHWLDVARYADSNGLDENVAFGNAWRYRDYVVHAFNQDKPYSQFIMEQLAGDLLPATPDLVVQHERLTALGFLCIGPKVLAEPDKVKLEMDLIDEQIETLGRAFMGATLGCARCHDHKFDPVPTDDYYSLAAIFKSTRTMDDLKTIAKWHEADVSRPEDIKAQESYAGLISTQKAALTNAVSLANAELLVTRKTNALPANPESLYPAATVAELKKLREKLAQLEKESPEPSSAMSVMEGTNILKVFPVHIRGSHLSLGKEVQRGVPQVMTLAARPQFDDQHSGRLELARWLVSAEHPLTARVMANRIWRWHFGQGLVASTDNFGTLGERPSHPELLDWLAQQFRAGGWSIKSLHRLIMLSSTYQMSTHGDARSSVIDAENKLLSHFPSRRLEAEEIRDSLHFVAGILDLKMGGKTIPLKNREFVFDHTSKDATRYDSARRAVYLPVIRNHLYDLFEQFDFPDPAVPTGSRNATVVAPQALLMMNSDLVEQAATKLAGQLLARTEWSDQRRLEHAYLRAYGRPPTVRELSRAQLFLDQFERTVSVQPSGSSAPRAARTLAWGVLCQTILAANEFIYLN